MGVSGLVEEECHMEMFVDYMDISQLTVFSQQIEESKIKKERNRNKLQSEESDRHGHSKTRQKYSDKATLVLIGMRISMSTPDLLILGMVRNMRVGVWLVGMVSMDLV